MFYRDPTTNEVRNLTEKENRFFGGLISAISKENIDFVQKALKLQPFLAHAFDEAGFTALNFASRHYTPAGLEIVRFLVDAGADIYAEDEDGFTAVHNVNRITDEALKAQFCEAMGIDIDTRAILDAMIDEKAEKIARERVEARWAAKEAAEAAGKPSASAAPDAYQRASSFEEKMRIDPDRALREYSNDPDVKRAMATSSKIREDIKILAVTEIIESDSAREAVEALISSKKSDQTIFSVTDELESLLDNMFSSKNSVIDGISQVLSKLLDIGVEGNLVTSLLIGIENMLTLAGSGHQFMGRPHGFDDFPDGDDFAGFGSGSIAGYLDNLPAPESSYVVTVLGNGTWVIAKGEEGQVDQQ